MIMEFTVGDTFRVLDDEIDLYVDGEIQSIPVATVTIVSHTDDGVRVKHDGTDKRLPLTLTIDEEDLSIAVGSWLESTD